ncbi:hypothetical protein [Schlesneria sp. DSM 10557]|uniref:hypothetical protein n=1 Tax=Schlesneria sp. DSM 10557 TaxID=3044399 RepID=UPI00359F50DF
MDGHSFCFPSTVSLFEVKAEQILLSVAGAYDDNADFLNDLRVCVRYFDNNSGNPSTVDVTHSLSKHYSDAVVAVCPDEAEFTHRLIDCFIDKVAFWEPDVTIANREARATEVLQDIYRRLPQQGAIGKLGNGNNAANLAEYHWFEVVHSILPSLPIDLNVVCQQLAGIELVRLHEPISLIFTTGPATKSLNGPAPLSRAARNDVGATFNRGGLFADLSVVYRNPLLDELHDIDRQLDAIRADIQLLQDDTNILFATIDQINQNLSTALIAYDHVKNTTNGIRIRVAELQNRIRENTGILQGISNRL